MKALITLLVMTTWTMSACSTSSSSIALGPGWEQLGTRTVNFKVDRDEIMVTRRDGKFRKIKLEVDNGSINFHECIVVFGDGSRQKVNIKKTLYKGQSTRNIDLKGGRRIINKVIMVYDTKNYANKKAKVKLYGLH